MRTDVVAILKAARDRVAKGWIQDRASNETGTRVCAARALTMAICEQPLPYAITSFSVTPADAEVINERTAAAGHLLLDAARERTMLSWGSIPMWNDHIDRTHEDVVETFDHAIKLAERDAS